MELSVFWGIHHTALFDWLAQLFLGLMRNAGRRERRGPFSHPLCMSLPNGRAPQKARSLIKSTTLQRLNLSSFGGDATRARLGFRSSRRDGGAGKHPGGKGKCTGQSRDTITTGSIAARGFAGGTVNVFGGFGGCTGSTGKGIVCGLAGGTGKVVEGCGFAASIGTGCGNCLLRGCGRGGRAFSDTMAFAGSAGTGIGDCRGEASAVVSAAITGMHSSELASLEAL